MFQTSIGNGPIQMGVVPFFAAPVRRDESLDRTTVARVIPAIQRILAIYGAGNAPPCVIQLVELDGADVLADTRDALAEWLETAAPGDTWEVDRGGEGFVTAILDCVKEDVAPSALREIIPPSRVVLGPRARIVITR